MLKTRTIESFIKKPNNNISSIKIIDQENFEDFYFSFPALFLSL